MAGYTDYCTCFYDSKEKSVYFWDEIKNKTIDKQKVKDRDEAGVVMRIWQDNAPQGIICQIIP